MPQIVAFAGPAGPAFSFSALSLPDHLISHPCKEELVFSHHCPWICPQLAHTASTGRGTHLAGIVPLLGFQSRTQGRTRVFLVSAPTFPTFPLRGKAGLFANWAVTVWWTRPQLAHTAPTGPVSRFPGVVSLPWLQNRTQGRTGPILDLTVFSSRLFSAAALPVGAPGGNSPPRGWAGSCKAVSRFSQFRPKSTRWSAGFR